MDFWEPWGAANSCVSGDNSPAKIWHWKFPDMRDFQVTMVVSILSHGHPWLGWVGHPPWLRKPPNWLIQIIWYQWVSSWISTEHHPKHNLLGHLWKGPSKPFFFFWGAQLPTNFPRAIGYIWVRLWYQQGTVEHQAAGKSRGPAKIFKQIEASQVFLTPTARWAIHFVCRMQLGRKRAEVGGGFLNQAWGIMKWVWEQNYKDFWRFNYDEDILGYSSMERNM